MGSELVGSCRWLPAFGGGVAHRRHAPVNRLNSFLLAEGLVNQVSQRSRGPAAYAQFECVWEAPFNHIPSETIGLSEIASYISDSVQEPGIDGLARTNLRFS